METYIMPKKLLRHSKRNHRKPEIFVLVTCSSKLNFSFFCKNENAFYMKIQHIESTPTYILSYKYKNPFIWMMTYFYKQWSCTALHTEVHWCFIRILKYWTRFRKLILQDSEKRVWCSEACRFPRLTLLATQDPLRMEDTFVFLLT